MKKILLLQELARCQGRAEDMDGRAMGFYSRGFIRDYMDLIS
jgi:hypothetical protein